MRLLSTSKVHVVEVHGVNTPAYAILSHTWSDEEILLQDVHSSDAYGSQWSEITSETFKTLGSSNEKGLSKMLKSTDLAARNGYRHIWIDTCCIDKTSSAELSEAINSMYRWYVEADICYAYLADVASAGTEDPFARNSTFRQSRWFNRGWTLQELIASRQVEFYAHDWSYLGSKNGEIEFTRLLNEITGIQLDVLTGEMSPQDMSIASRMHWAADRQTTRVEDVAYCLLGIFDVNMPLLYGEGKRSFIRLQEAILSREEDQSLFAWHSESLTVDEEDQTWQVDSSSGLSGLLADSPDKFWDDSDIEMTMPLTLTGSPPTVSSKGLGVDFLLLPCEDNQLGKEADFRVVLNCERIKNGQRESPVIYLKRIWGLGDQFARVRSDLRTFVPPNISLLEGGTDERVFVKQDPSSDIRIIRVLSAKNAPQLQLPRDLGGHQLKGDWKIKDAWPKQGWAERNQTFQTRNLTFGLPCGIFRLELDAAGHSKTIDVAVGMHATSERLCRSWCQIMTRDSFLDPESAFSWAMREAESGKITYNELSTHDIHGSDMSTWVIVTERNRKRGVDITLHVLSQLAHQEEEEVQREEYGQIIPLSTLSEGEVPLGSKVRIGSRRGGPASLGSIKDYCLNALPAGDTETRRTVQVLFGGDAAEAWSYLDASRILEGRSDSFLQLRPVHWAVIGGNVEILRTLLKAGIDAAGKSDSRQLTGKADRRLTTLHLAMLSETADVFNCLFEFLFPPVEGEGFESDVMRALEQLEATVNNEDYPLHFAASYATTAQFWKSSGFQVLAGQLTNRLGEVPLHRACAMGNIAAVEYLLTSPRMAAFMPAAEGVSRIDNWGRTPLWHAACSDYTGSITKNLLVSGARMNVSDLNGLAPIHVSCRQGTVGCLRRLKAAGANLNLPAGALGLLPAHFAAIFGHKRCMEILLRGTANILTGEVNGFVVNALHLAIANGQEPCARAIWDSLNPKPEFRGWSPCITLESSGPVFKWMHLEVNDQYWFAIEDPLKEGGTKDFVCLTAEERTPKLWVEPGLKAPASQDRDDEDKEAEDAADDEHNQRRDSWRAYPVEHSGGEWQATTPDTNEELTKPENKGLRKASRAIRSLFNR
ncbi:hypothetical protein B0T10DRAFT_438408 [Thelonectria olida]|uniref:Heterokaryon incompatibility domain-containing protein n=1 Tax=Thelonectria olida TaxID=1576542 RepID=A0A9P8W6W5_9HYPO|nr:hypothetical protein B0T10DRAFT_438408 [Thelonectria olida]